MTVLTRLLRTAVVVAVVAVPTVAGCSSSTPVQGAPTPLVSSLSPSPVTSGSASASASALPVRLGPSSTADDFRRFLESAPAIRLAMAFGGSVYCGVDVMGRSSDRRYAYVWALCEEFYRQAGKVLPGSGIAAPVLFDTRASTLTLPGDGTQYGPDVRRLFPPAIATAMLANQVQPDQNDAALTARAERDLLGVPPATSTPAASAP
jgi:hypothetical protein